MEHGQSPWSWHLSIGMVVAVSMLYSLFAGPSANFGTAAQGVDKQAPPSFNPEVAVQTDDYGEVRKTFRTKLSRHGPSPQKEPMIAPPAGVSAVEFPSGELRLKAWVNAPQADNSAGSRLSARWVWLRQRRLGDD
jgi:hypothetical protein